MIVKYNSWRLDIENGNGINFLTHNVALMLVSSIYSPLKTHSTLNDIHGQVSGTGYTPGGATLTNKTLTMDSEGNLTANAEDLLWPQSISGFSDARYGILYSTNNNKLLGYINFGSDKNNVSGDFSIKWSSTGIYSVKEKV